MKQNSGFMRVQQRYVVEITENALARSMNKLKNRISDRTLMLRCWRF